ncbi:ATP-dependent DNA helicase pif1-like [Gordionus sp. m RMFG-2023]|uniref:ATP-dependent DNA helicase pif1-like n=1 Tax=Gordionus sp. m RMFG-2023 TaxID=3053472 RepID=UPI0031FCEB14
MQTQFPFGGKVILLGGDFRQTLPVIPNSSKAYIIESCLKSSDLWVYFKVIHLNENIRLSSEDVEYNSWLLNVGESLSNVSNPLLPPDSIVIPNSLLENSLIKSIYGDSIQISDINLFSKKIILTTKNNIALNLNNEIIQKLPGNSKIYFSADSIQTDNPEDLLNFPIEFLHSQTPSGMPPHILNLKVGTIIMLLRNMNPSRGLCNGTRLLIKNLHDNFIDSEILSRTHNGHRVFIPRIDLSPSDSRLPFILKRRQFPIIPAFVISINKSQGQTFDNVGLFLPEPVFSHGQLYVALTRCRFKKI